MHPAKIIGTVVATKKYETLVGFKLLILQPTDWEGNAKDDYIIAVDAVGAGEGEFVFYVESMEAALVFDSRPVVDASVVGIIDGIFLDYELYNGGEKADKKNNTDSADRKDKTDVSGKSGG
jgi:ethanolamine utilization protein EutN